METQKRKERPLWRISSTLFYHVASDELLKPLERFLHGNDSIYPEMLAGNHVEMEIAKIDQ